jgi:ABC-type nitrate/sulfonate/bicarbonate transport system permease component
VAPRLHHSNWSYGWLGVLGFVATLELLTQIELIPSRQFPPPSDTIRALAAELGRAALWRDLGSTLGGWAVGLALASAIALPLGIALGSNALLYRSLRFPIEFLRPIPAVALIPVVVLVSGTGFESKLFLVTFASIWPLLIQTIYGMQDADPVGRETARAFQVGRVDRLVRVTLPGAVPYLATGLRLASSVALTLAVTAEIVIGAEGLGRSIDLASQGGEVRVMYALIVVTGIVGWSLNAVFARAERRVLHWHATARRTEATP